MGGFLDEVAERFGPNEALVFDDPLRGGETVRWTYADLRHESERIARGAGRRRASSAGSAVGILMGNRPEAVAALFGVTSIGATAVLMSTFAPRPELAFMIELAETEVVLTQERLLARRFGDDLAALAGDRPSLRRVAAVGTSDWDDFLAGGDGASTSPPADLSPSRRRAS